ncbi:23S rRNA (guanosine2251-2'-O)-methyltransferase [Desulfovibrionales bacterium]
MMNSHEMVIGKKPVLELLRTRPEQVDGVFVREGTLGPDLRELRDLCRQAKVRYQICSAGRIERMFGKGTQGFAARIYAPGFLSPEILFRLVLEAPLPLLLVLDQVQDPGNLGTLARSCYGLGVGGLLLPKHNSAALGEGAARAAAGTLDRLPIAKATNLGNVLGEAADLGFTVYGTIGHKGENVFVAQLTLPAVLVLGGEETGVRPGVAKRCDRFLSIPLARELDSLNMAQAGAILLGQFAVVNTSVTPIKLRR